MTQVEAHSPQFISYLFLNSFSGPGALAFLSHLLPSSLSSLQPFTSTLSVLLNHEGGILDDTVVTRQDGDKFYVVTNAGRRKEDLAWIKDRLKEWNGDNVKHDILENWGLVALQGECSAKREKDRSPCMVNQKGLVGSQFVFDEAFNSLLYEHKESLFFCSSFVDPKADRADYCRRSFQFLHLCSGPQAAEVLSKHTDLDLSKLTFGKSAYAKVAGVECHIARGGYTGEDGFEVSLLSSDSKSSHFFLLFLSKPDLLFQFISQRTKLSLLKSRFPPPSSSTALLFQISIPPSSTVDVTRVLVETSPVQLAGLAARDSLRLEAGMCLYGHDLDESVSPIEAGLAWTVGE